MIRILSLVSLLLCLLTGVSEAQWSDQMPPGVARGGPIDTNTLTATGGSAVRPLADVAGDFVSVKDKGAKGDGRITSPVATIAAGSASLTTATAQFSAKDVGKTLVLGNAAVTPTTGPVVAIPVINPGAAHTAAATCAITDASGGGSGATCAPLYGLVGATLTAGGAGCAADGVYEFTLGFNTGTPAKLSGTVTGGALVGSLTVTAPGLLAAPGVTSGAALYGANCTTPPAVTLSYGVSAVQVTALGTNGYSPTQTTATLSGGTAGTPATLGPVTVAINVPPLVTTIAAYVSPTQVTLAATASTSLSGATAQMLVATDDTAAIQAAISAASGPGKVGGIWVPPGVYWISSRLSPGVGDLTVRGSGRETSVLVWDAGIQSTQNGAGWSPMFAATGVSRAQMRGSFTFEGIQFRGLLDFGRVNTGASVLEMNYFESIVFDKVKFFQVPRFAMALEGLNNFTVTNSIFDWVMRDQARCRSCFNVFIRGNLFRHSDDDSIALHQSLTGIGNIRESLIVEDNTFEDTTGVAILGARSAIVARNIFRRTKFGAVRIFADAGEGAYPMRGIFVLDNMAYDVLSRPPFVQAQQVFLVTHLPPTSPTGISRLVPGAVIQGALGFPRPWNYDINKGFDGTQYAAGTRGVTVRGNLYMRTLPATAAYSSWGFGKTLTSAGPLDIPVPDAAMLPFHGILASVNSPDLDISYNKLDNLQRGIALQDNVAVPDLARARITFNTTYDTWEYGIVGFGTGNMSQLDIIGNLVDVDPYNISPGRSGTGAGDWSVGYGLSKCLIINYTANAQMHFNTFANCSTVQDSPNWLMSNNILRGNPFSGTSGQPGYNASNHGFGTYPALGGGAYFLGNVIVPGSNTSTSTQGALSSAHPTRGAVAPTSGYGAFGEVIASTDPAACTCSGWVRLKSGTSWVAGTDYKAIPLQ